MKFRSVALASATLLALVPAGMAQGASHVVEPTVLADELITPLHLSVGPGGTVAVSQSFAGMLSTVGRDGAAVAYANPGWAVGGVDYQGSTLYFVESVGAGEGDPDALSGALKSIDARGNVKTITDQFAEYEIANNPDAGQHYGLSTEDAAANPQCVAELGEVGFPASYMGALDSHPYSLLVRGNTAYVADAGANAILAVNLKSGAISTLTVFPPQPATIPADWAEEEEVPSCGDLEYAFEPVPTDLEFGPDGKLYVGLLPGGPEDPALGARGSVVSVNVSTGGQEIFLDELMSPTGLAFDGDGNLYVASLFGEGVLKFVASEEPEVVLGAPLVTDVEIKGSTLYALTQALFDPPAGELVSLKLR